ncbi:WhiB family transcriptional regulator [Streptomyces canus]|uniref:WhiB family transcriptional regulator n=1 Tax=Streptomyces canus TaxID=58343 RepID=UPI0009A0F22F|nr:WhiB family transcriptional regulator [Streptomyces canus]
MDWQELAICQGTDPDLFFPVGNASSGPTLIQTAEAKAVCRRCPVIDQCLNWALDADLVEGIWGGTTEAERRAMRRRSASGAGRATVKPAA